MGPDGEYAPTGQLQLEPHGATDPPGVSGPPDPPQVFTSVNPSVTPGDSLTPSFIAARGRATGTADPDYSTSDRRHELLGDLMRRSNGLRSHGDVFMAGQGFPVDSSAPKLHSEHFVTDGTSARFRLLL